MSELISKCCGKGIMTPEDYIFYEGGNTPLDFLDLSEIDWICVSCGQPTEVVEAKDKASKGGGE